MEETETERFVTRSESDTVEEGITLGELFGMLRKHVVSIVVVTVAVFAVVAIYTFTCTPQYTATAQLFATYQVTSQDSGDATEYNSGASYINSQIETYPQLVKTEAVLQPVIDDLGLSMTVDELAEKVTASNPEDTMLVDIDVEDSDPKTAASIANSVATSMRDLISNSTYDEDGEEINSPVYLTIVQQAYVPSEPSSPNVAMYLAIGLVGGLLLGIVVAIVRDLLDSTVRQASDVNAITHSVPVLGTVMKSDMYGDKGSVIISRPMSKESEDIRRLRTNLSFASLNDDPLSKVIVVASSGADEGKTTLSINLAAAFAESGGKVLLIDADVRNPSVSDRLGIEGTIGLTHLVTGQAQSKDVIQQYWKENFHILPAGEQTMNPSVLMNSRAMRSLVSQVADAYDHVIIDTTPMQVANDAVIFAKDGASLLMVVGLNVANKKRLSAAIRELNTIDVHPVGFALNLAEPDKQKDDSSYYYYYGDEDDKGRHRKSRSEKK